MEGRGENEGITRSKENTLSHFANASLEWCEQAEEKQNQKTQQQQQQRKKFKKKK